MEVKVSQRNGVKFAIQARQHTVVSDQPRKNGGDDTGMTPPEFLLASLGSCAAYYAAQYLKSRNLAEGGVEVTVSAEKLKQPARLGNFRVTVTSPVHLDETQTERLLQSVHHCLVHNTLLTPPQIAIDVTVAAEAVV